MDRAFSSRFRLLLFDISNEAPCADEVLRTIPLPYAPFHALFILVEISRLPAKWMREMKQFDYNLCISLLVADTPFPLSGVVSSSPLALLNSLRRRWRERCQIDCQTILQNKCRNRNRYCMVWVTRKSNLSGFQTFPCIGTGRSCPMRGFAWTRGMGDGLLGTAHTPCHLKRVYERCPHIIQFCGGTWGMLQRSVQMISESLSRRLSYAISSNPEHQLLLWIF